MSSATPPAAPPASAAPATPAQPTESGAAPSLSYLDRLFGLHGKVAVVTGSTGGLGRAMAKGLAQAGATVVINGRSAERTARAAAELAAESGGGRFVPVAADVGKQEEAEHLVRTTVQQCGRLDILVNNAGVNLEEASFEGHSLADWRSVQQANVEGPLNLTRAALPHLKLAPAGRIIMLSSIAGHVGTPNNVMYSMTKGAVAQLTRSLTAELADQCPTLTVNSISPGVFATPMNSKFDSGPARDAVLSAIPVKRLAEPEELVTAVLYLASPASSYATGSDVLVDGGYVAP